MATVYKRTRRKPLPEAAEIVTRNGKQYAVWTSRRRRHRAELSEDGRAVLVEGDEYTVEYFDHNGKRRRVASGTPDKDAAQRLANQLETAAMERKKGLADPRQERFAAEMRRPLLEHLQDFRESMRAKGDTPRHCCETHSNLLKILDLCEAKTIGDLEPTAVEKAILTLRDGDRALATCNRYLTAIKGFSKWLYTVKRSREDTLACLKRFNEAADPRHVRREATPEEVAWLLADY